MLYEVNSYTIVLLCIFVLDNYKILTNCYLLIIKSVFCHTNANKQFQVIKLIFKSKKQ